MNGNDDLAYKLELIFVYIKEMIKWQKESFAKQEELFALFNRLHADVQLERIPQKVWLTKTGVMDELCISERTFYRRLHEENWERTKNGGTWYYLKSSLI